MSTLARVALSLAAFLFVAAVVYGVTSREPTGTTTLFVASVTFAYLGLVTRNAGKRETEEPEPLVHVGPTIWPFGFAVSAVLLVLGLLVTPWLMILAVIGFGSSAAGWLRDVDRSRRAEHP